MTHTTFNRDYWENRYNQKETGWDCGTITEPLKTYFDQVITKESSILITGAGNGHEFEYLIQNGFTNVYVLDIAEQPIANIRERLPNVAPNFFLHHDFFELDGQFDLIVEQTFFCALDVKLRKAYVQKMKSLLKPGGKLVGLLFQFPLTESGPPFGGSRAEYMELFSADFDIKVMETAYNSIKPREGNELFVIFTKK